MVGEGESRPAKRTVRLFGAGLSVVKSTSGSREPALVNKEIFRDITEPVLTCEKENYFHYSSLLIQRFMIINVVLNCKLNYLSKTKAMQIICPASDLRRREASNHSTPADIRPLLMCSP